jgi:hypothetical protein
MVNSAFIKKLWHWFDNSFFFWFIVFLAVFIPLYPKIPLGEIIPGYIVRVRLEDVFIFTAIAWWGLQILRHKLEWRTPITAAVLLYAAVGLLSNVLGVVLTKTIPPELLHFGKSMLHWLRYIEYFSLFFMAYAVIKTKKQVGILLGAMVATTISVAIYGYGQKYLYWPVYSTMNREFSKGMRLYLGPFARVQSTFAGHYDLGAYLVVVLPLFLALYFWLARFLVKPTVTKKWFIWLVRGARISLIAAWLSGLWLLVLSASRTSFIGYMVGIGLVVLALMLKKRAWWWGISRGFTVALISVIIMFVVGELPTRFGQLIDQNKYPQFHYWFHTINDLANHPYKLLGLAAPKVQQPANGIAVGDVENSLNQQGMTVSDTQPTAEKPTSATVSARPSDVQIDVPENTFAVGDPNATLAANLHLVDGRLVQERVFSACALQRSLSLCIRLETLWPRAFQGFTRNPLFGSGYATLTKSMVGEFTEAESTDNNFLRTLGETGGLGFFFFYGSIGLLMWYSFQAYRRSEDGFTLAIAIGAFAGAVGLLINAMYIDVFASSKVAYTFWMLQGVVLALLVRFADVAPRYAFEKQKQQSDTEQLRAMLEKIEQNTKEKHDVPHAYVSSSKRRAKSINKQRPGVHRR